MKFRKKPVVIEATRWWANGDHPGDRVGEQVVDVGKMSETHPELFDGRIPVVIPSDAPTYTRLEGAVVRFYRHPDLNGQTYHRDIENSARPNCGYIMHVHGWIDTMEGGHTVCPGDWIITGIQGEVYPCEASIFEDSYEPVE